MRYAFPEFALAEEVQPAVQIAADPSTEQIAAEHSTDHSGHLPEHSAAGRATAEHSTEQSAEEIATAGRATAAEDPTKHSAEDTATAGRATAEDTTKHSAEEIATAGRARHTSADDTAQHAVDQIDPWHIGERGAKNVQVDRRSFRRVEQSSRNQRDIEYPVGTEVCREQASATEGPAEDVGIGKAMPGRKLRADPELHHRRIVRGSEVLVQDIEGDRRLVGRGSVGPSQQGALTNKRSLRQNSPDSADETAK